MGTLDEILATVESMVREPDAEYKITLARASSMEALMKDLASTLLGVWADPQLACCWVAYQAILIADWFNLRKSR